MTEPPGTQSRRLTSLPPMRVGFIGLGIMGSRQAANLVRAGHELRVFNRTRETAEAWAAEHKAEVADSPRAAAEGADAVITMVVDGAQVEAMLLGEDGAVAGAPEGTLFIDCSTIAPADARRLGATLREQGHGLVDAPVTGSAPKAEDGTLTIMAGGSDEDMARAMPLLEAMGKLIVHCGDVGQGQAVKVISNSVSAINCAAIAQALVVGPAGGRRPRVARRGDGRRARPTRRCSSSRPARCSSTTSPPSSSSSTCSRTSASASTRRGPRARRSCSPRWRASSTAPGVGRGLGEQDFAAVLEVLEDLGGAKV